MEVNRTGINVMYIRIKHFHKEFMNLDHAIVLETFPNRIAAELAAGLLESEGVEAMVAADDAGGTYPCSSSSGACASWSTGRTRPGPGRSSGTWKRGRAGAGIGGEM